MGVISPDPGIFRFIVGGSLLLDRWHVAPIQRVIPAASVIPGLAPAWHSREGRVHSMILTPEDIEEKVTPGQARTALAGGTFSRRGSAGPYPPHRVDSLTGLEPRISRPLADP
jgi:hypothetical protein